MARKVTDPRLGEVTILQNKKNGTFVGLQTVKANSEEQIENYKKLFSSRNKLEHPNVAAPMEIFFKKENAFCGSRRTPWCPFRGARSCSASLFGWLGATPGAH